MSVGKPIHLYALAGEPFAYLFHPHQANRVNARVDLVRQNYYTLRFQFVRTTDFDLSSTLTAPTSAQWAIDSYTDIIFGLKTSTTATDFTAAWRGFNTSDTAWHALASGRCSIDIAPTSDITLASYISVARLLNNTSYFDVPDLGLETNLRQNLITGAEPSSPSGAFDGNSYTGTVTAGNSSVAITISGMTTGGRVVPFFVGNPVSTIGATCATNTVTVTLGGPVDSNTTVGVYVIKRS